MKKDALGWYVSKLAAYTYPRYPLLASLPWKFIKLGPEGKTGPRIEGGNPFTRGAIYSVLPKFTTPRPCAGDAAT